MVSCEKKGDIQPVAEKEENEEILSGGKAIPYIMFGPEIPLQKTGEEYYVMVEYPKHYTEKDNVRLTINGQAGVISSEISNNNLKTNMILFKFPANSQIGDMNAKLVVDNGQKVYEEEKVIRFVSDYTLPTIWQNLDEEYLSQLAFVGRRLIKGGSSVLRIRKPQNTTYDIHGYFLNTPSSSSYVFAPFIKGLNGRYELTFAEGKIRSIQVVHTQLSTDPDYRFENTNAELNSEYEYVSGDLQNAIYKKDKFTLQLKARDPRHEIYTLITKEY